MRLFHNKKPIDKEWERLLKDEKKFCEGRAEKSESLLNKKLEEIIPEKLQDTLNTAFAKAFGLILEKGTSFIEKTYKKEELEKNFQINEYTEQIRENSKSLKAFSKSAKKAGNVNLLISGVSGIGMGVLGIGIPDIPIFLGMLLKSIYEIALSYGYSYDTEEERYFILLLIEGAVSYGERLTELNEKVDFYIEEEQLPDDYDREEQIRQTSESLSKELLYMKFLQGIPVIGAIGGTYDAVYIKKITSYASLKYKKRFLNKKRKFKYKNLKKM